MIASCTNSAEKAAKAKADSLSAQQHFDSMQNAIKAMKIQDSLDALKAADSTKKADSAKAKK